MYSHSSTSDHSSQITSLSGSVSWNETMQMMSDLLQLYEKQEQSPLMQSLRECMHLQKKLEQRKEILLNQSRDIQARIHSVTDQCSQLLEIETKTIHSYKRNMDELQDELERIRGKTRDVQRQLDDANQQIQTYTEISDDVEELDSLEMEKKEEVPRLRRQLSMHATATGIKWDYDRVDALVGEVSIPEKKILKRFCIDLDQHSNFEVANKVWDIIDPTSD